MEIYGDPGQSQAPPLSLVHRAQSGWPLQAGCDSNIRPEARGSQSSDPCKQNSAKGLQSVPGVQTADTHSPITDPASPPPPPPPLA